MGTIDRLIRLAIVIVVAALYFSGQIGGLLSAILGVLSLVFLATSLVGSCPLYSLFGISTCRMSTKT
jgi:hypothetical protein